MNDINALIQNIAQARNSGKNPQAIMQMLMQRNPQTQQMLATFKNMAQGRNPQEFVMQLAKQNGANEQSLQTLQGLFR